MVTGDDESSDVKDIRLNTTERWVSGVAAVLVAAAAAAYVTTTRTITTVAPQCVGGTNCAVEVSAPSDSVLLIGLLTLAALFGLMAVTSPPFSITLGNGVALSVSLR